MSGSVLSSERSQRVALGKLLICPKGSLGWGTAGFVTLVFNVYERPHGEAASLLGLQCHHVLITLSSKSLLLDPEGGVSVLLVSSRDWGLDESSLAEAQSR